MHEVYKFWLSFLLFNGIFIIISLGSVQISKDHKRGANP